MQKVLKLYVYHRDMTPGALRDVEVTEAMAKSRKIIILMSNSYIKSGECKFEAGLSRESVCNLLLWILFCTLAAKQGIK